MTKAKQRRIDRMVSLSMVKAFLEVQMSMHLWGNSRQRRDVIYRHCFLHIIKRNTSLSLTSIGGLLGRDHATVLHACKNHEGNYKYDPDYIIVYDKMLDDARKYFLENGLVPKDLYISEDVKLTHFRFLDVSKKLRDVISDYSDYKKSVKEKEKEFKAFKVYSTTLRDRIHTLEAELKRVKNLI